MDGTAVKEIERLTRDAEVGIIDRDGVPYATRPLHRLPLAERRREEKVDAIHVGSLSAVVDYLAVQKDGLDPATHFVHVEGPRSVRVVGSLLDQGETNQRHTYLTATVQAEPFPWGKHIRTDEMIVAVQSRFAETDDRARLFQILGNMATEEGLKVEDDGVSQRATVKDGVARLKDVSIENPFSLAPFRTCREVEPPVSPFVLRLAKGGDGFVAGLWEADGGAWEVEAVSRIRDWLNHRVAQEELGYQIIG